MEWFAEHGMDGCIIHVVRASGGNNWTMERTSRGLSSSCIQTIYPTDAFRFI